MANRDIEAAHLFHEVTSHSYTSVRSGAHMLDWGNRPLPYKIYPGAGKIVLPRELHLPAVSTLAALRGAASASDTAATLETLTRLLFCADGLTRRVRVGAEDYHFRAAPSAGALYPIEIYVAASEVEGLERGLYHFSPADLKMSGLRRGDWRPYLARAAGGRESISEARSVLVLTAIFWRSAWKYRDRAYRYCFWDTGTILANLLAAANAEGLSAEVITAFVDAEIEFLLGIDGDREGVMCLVPLGRTTPAIERSPEAPPLELESIPLSPNERVHDDIVKIHRASRLSSAEEVRSIASVRIDRPGLPSAGEIFAPEPLSSEDSMGLGETILRRGSTRVFTREAIGSDELAAILAASSGPIAADFPRLTETYLIVNAVEGMESGAYYYRRESGAFESIKAGNFRREAGYLCLEQPLGADCAALIVYMANLERVLHALGNRGYGDAHLEAGLMGGRAYLVSYALGCGATGLTFYDSDTAAFFSSHAAGMAPLLMIAIGVPRTRNADMGNSQE